VRIVFVANNRNRHRFLEDPSFLYRCENLAAGLRARGHDASLTHVSHLPPWTKADVVVFHRPRASLRQRLLRAALRRRGVRLIADVDDLIFDESLAEFSPGVRNGLVALDATREAFAAHRRALAEFDMISVSTCPLVERVTALFPAARVARLPNAVHHTWRNFRLPLIEPSARSPVLMYLPGTRSHDRDFATVAPVLERLLERHPTMHLHITGRLAFQLEARPGQVQHRPRVHYSRLHPIVRAGWLNIAPLEQTPFTSCKSALKVIEAGFWGIPTVCAPLPDAGRFASAGVLPAATEADWCRQIEQLLAPEVYAAASADLRERVLARADVYKVAERFEAFVAGDCT